MKKFLFSMFIMLMLTLTSFGQSQQQIPDKYGTYENPGYAPIKFTINVYGRLFN